MRLSFSESQYDLATTRVGNHKNARVNTTKKVSSKDWSMRGLN